MATPPQTISCPRCRNINPWSATECLNPQCSLPLGPIRALLGEHDGGDEVYKAEIAAPAAASPLPVRAVEPTPVLPELAERGEQPPETIRAGGDQFLVVGIGDRADEIRARFFKRLADAGIEGLKLSTGQLVIEVGDGKSDTRPYDFAERDLGEKAVATIAVRLAPIGKDLYVNWRHYELPSMKLLSDGSAVLFALFIVFGGWIFSVGTCSSMSAGRSGNSGAGFIVFLVILVGSIWLAITIGSAKRLQRTGSLEGFQSQESAAFQLTVRGAILGAIDDAGIDRALVQRQDDGGGPSNRVI